MKKLFTLCLLTVSMFISAQNRKIALLEPRAGEETTVSGMEKAMVRGELRKAIVNHTGYEAFTRSDIDQLMNEQGFQRTGNVSEEDIHKLGEMSGADYICVSTLNKSNTEFYIEAYLIDIESGVISNPASQYGELVDGKLSNMLPVCQALAQELLGTANPVVPISSRSIAKSTSNSTSTKPIAEKSQVSNLPSSVKYVDLGVSVLWAVCNVGASNPEDFGNYYAWGSKTTKSSDAVDMEMLSTLPTLPPSADAATIVLGSKWRMPTETEWEELRVCCNWNWTMKNGVYGYEVFGSKYGYTDNSIFLPAAGFINSGKKNNVGYIGCYWSSTIFAKNKNCAYGLSFTSKKYSSVSFFRTFCMTIRPVATR